MNTARSPRMTRAWIAAAALIGALVVAACGGGVGSGGTGSAGGLSVGTVTGFGSIIVDGVRYDDRGAGVRMDSESGAPDASARVDVKLGQRVELAFSGSESASAASEVRIAPEIVGTVSATAPNLVVAGQSVKVNTDAAAGPVTVFEGYASAADIQVGDRVEVHGTPLADGSVQATRIERKPLGAAWLRVTGTVASLAPDGKSFKLGTLTVTVAGTTRIVPAGSTLAEGQRVVVWSDTAISAGAVTATLVRVKRSSADGSLEARIAGPVTGCTPPCAANFKVGGITVDASAATFVNGSAADLADGKWVALRGTLDATANTLKATRVVLHQRGDDDDAAKLRGAITDFVDATNFKVRGVPVTTDAGTVVGASCPKPLANGTLVAITGSVRGGAVLAATVDCFTVPDGFTIEGRGKILTVDSATKTFTLDGPLVGSLSFVYSDATVFDIGKTAADLAVGTYVEVKGSVSGTTVTVTRVAFEDEEHTGVPATGLFTTQGIASGVTTQGTTVTSFSVGSLAFTLAPDARVITNDGPLVDGARVKVVFRKVGTTNVALVVKTDD